MRTDLALSMVKTKVVALTFIIACLLSFTVTPKTVWLDWISLVLLFWVVYRPVRLSLVWVFSLGLLMDVQYNTFFGEHVLKYLWLTYFGGHVARRLQYSSIFIHALVSVTFIFSTQLLHALMYLLLSGLSVNLLSMIWIFSGIPVWLLLARLLSQPSSTVIGSWLLE